MKKPKIFLRSIFYAIVIAQMVFAPMAPVIADDLNAVSSETAPSAMAETPAGFSLSTPTVEPVVESLSSQSLFVADPVNVTMNAGSASEIPAVVHVPNLSISENTATSALFVANVSGESTEVATTSILSGSPKLNEPSQNESSVVVTSTNDSNTVEELSPSTTPPTIILDVVEASSSTASTTALQKADKEEELNSDEPDLNSAPEATMEDFNLPKISGEGAEFEMMSPIMDIAEIEGKKKIIRLFSNARPVIQDKSGKFRKITKAKEGFFARRKNANLSSDMETGYKFDYVSDASHSVRVSAGSLEIVGGNIFGPNYVSPGVHEEGLKTISQFENIYPNVDVRFTDVDLSRGREIIIKKKTDANNSDMIFWEKYKYPAGSSILDWDLKPLTDGQSIRLTPVLIGMPNGETFEISAPIVYDSSGNEFYAKALNYLVKIDKSSNELSLGIMLDAQFLNQSGLKYPVIIDPTYTVCKTGGVNPRTCNGYYDLYFRLMTDLNGTSITQNDSMPISPAAPFQGTGLFTGYWKSGNQKTARSIGIRFSDSAFLGTDSDGTITNAALHVYFLGPGGGGTVTNVAMSAKRISSNLTLSSALYSGVVTAGISDDAGLNNSSNSQVISNLSAGDKSFNITSLVEEWFYGWNNGLILEPTQSWNGNLLAVGQPAWPDRIMGFGGSEGANDPYLEFTLEYPDLTNNSSAPTSYSVQPGQNLRVNFSIKNQGTASPGQGPLVQYYFNSSANCSSPNSPLVSGSYTAAIVPVGSPVSNQIDIPVPANTPAGNYCVYAKIDSNSVIYEGSPAAEANNDITISGITVASAPAPDLTYSGTPTVAPNPTSPGSTVSFNATIQNIGSQNSSVVAINYYFDGTNIGSHSLSSISAGGSTSVNKSLTIPPSASVGNHTISFTIGTASGETVTANNTFSTTISVGGNSDLQPQNFTISNNSVIHYSGTNDYIDVSGSVRNLGTGAASNVTYSLKIYGTGYVLSGVSPATLTIPANTTQSVTLRGIIPSGMPYSGTYRIQIQINKASNESNDTNNTVESTNTVPIQQYYVGGGGGSVPDSDGDGQNDLEELAGGTPLTQQEIQKLFDLGYLTYTSGPNDPKGADPVNLRNGALEFEQTDFALPAGVGFPLQFTRTYNSRLTNRSARFGNGWSHSYNIFYYKDASSGSVEVYFGGTRASIFTTSDGGLTYTAPKGVDEQLAKEGVYLVYKTMDGIKYKFSLQLTNNMGLLQEIQDTNGNKTALNYQYTREVPLLKEIVDSVGRKLTFTYPTSTDPLWDKVSEIHSLVGGVDRLEAKYTYNASSSLVGVYQEVNYSGEAKKEIRHSYTYDTDGKNLMLTYSDARSTTLYNVYDANSRVTEQYESSPTIAKRKIYELNYAPGLVVADSTHCTRSRSYRDANNSYDEDVCFNSDELKIYSGKGDNIERWTYDTKGMPASYVDALGNVTTYVYDTQRRLIQEVSPDINGKRTVVTYDYWSNPNRLKTKTETVTSGGQTLNTRTTSYTVPQDGKGNVTQISYPAGASESIAYNANGTVSTFTNKLGTTTTFGYNANGYRTSESAAVVKADNTNQTIIKQYGYDNYGNKTSYTDPNNNVYSFVYDSRSNLRREINPAGDSKTYEYDLEDSKTKETDELGRVTRFNYDTDINSSLLNITKESPAGNIVHRREYDYVGNLKKEIDPLGREVSLTYDAANRIITKTDPKKTSTYEYYANNLLKKETNTAGQRTDYFYDARGNKTEARKYYDDASYVSNKWEYDGLNRPTKQTDGNSFDTTLEYDNADRVIAKTDAKGGITEYFYDNGGNKIGERTPRAHDDVNLRNANGHSTSYVYDGAGRLIKIRNAADKMTINFYDANGNLTQIIDRQNGDGTLNSHVTNIEYYPNNLKKKEVYAGGGQVEYAYDKVGNLKTKKDQMNRTWTNNYDDFNRLTSEVDPAGKTTGYKYDAANNKTEITYSDGTKTNFVYNELNLLTGVTDAANNTASSTYNSVGNKLTETDKRGNVTVFEYDKIGRLIQETNPALTTTTYTYDGNNNRLTESVGGKTTIYDYDELNRNKKITYPGVKTENFSYDKNGNKISYTDGKNQITTFDYDKLDRLTTKHLPGAVPTVDYSYDNWNNLTRLVDESGITDYIYDANNRLSTETKVLNDLQESKVVSRTYNLAGQLESITDAAGRTVNYVYNNRGLLNTVSLGQDNLATYTYNSFGKPETLTYGNGLVTSYGYDVLNRTASIETKNASSTVLFRQEYQYDKESNRTQMVETRMGDDGLPVSSTVAYTYDNLEQLTDVDYQGVNGVGNDLSYRYDHFGNRTELSDLSGSAAYTYTAGTNELSSVSYNSGKMTVQSLYDGNGSLTKETYSRLGTNTQEVNYTWDAQNRLAGISYHNTGQPAFAQGAVDNYLQFTYDDFGNRVKKASSNDDTRYYINNGLTVLNELNSTGTVTKSIIRGLDQIAEIDESGIISYTHQDVLGSAVMISDQQGNMALQYEYDPFGQIITETGDIASETSYLFTNQEFDPESELYYYNARYYNPVLGRFISRDTVLGRDGDVLSRNLYIYVKNNPLKYTDPTGNEKTAVTNYFLDKLKQVGDDYSSLKPKSGIFGWLSGHCQTCTNMVGLDNLLDNDLALIPDEFYSELGNNYNIVKKYKQDFTTSDGVPGKYNIKSFYPNEDWGLLTNEQMSSIAKKLHSTTDALFNTPEYGFAGLEEVKITGVTVRFDVPGNILYGYAGAAGGLSEEFVLMLAGLGNKQEWLERQFSQYSDKFGGLLGSSYRTNPKFWQNQSAIRDSYPYSWSDTYFDDPVDNAAVKMGYDLWMQNSGQQITADILSKYLSR